jgi:hypothetical protein
MTCTRVFIIVGCLALASSGGLVAEAAPSGQAVATPVPRDSLEPFLNRYCIDCHNAEEANGQVRFDTVSWQIDTNDTAQRWQDVLDQLNGGAMPPEEAPQPDESELRCSLAALTTTIQEARRRLTDHGGTFTLRRLNRREYSATIRHLFGFDVPLDEIPEDGSISSFDTVGAEQFFSSVHFEKYLALGRKVADEAFTWTVRPRQPTKVHSRAEPEDRVTEQLRKHLADLDQKMAMKQAGKTWQEMGFEDEGDAEIVFRQFRIRAGHPRKYLEYPRVDDGVYLGVGVLNETKWVTNALHTDIRGDYIIRIHGGVHGSPDPIRTIALVRDQHEPKGTARSAAPWISLRQLNCEPGSHWAASGSLQELRRTAPAFPTISSFFRGPSRRWTRGCRSGSTGWKSRARSIPSGGRFWRRSFPRTDRFRMAVMPC